ncbi:MAG: hypothetical protein FWD36_09840 [Treponema sp.]|nr:hypothetical protein [Treponema sp.]
MKKILSLCLVLLFLSPVLFADDAKTMPGKVGRLYLAPSMTFVPGQYDEKAKRSDYEAGTLKIFNLGFALEYGFNDWITGAAQWAPGITVASDIKPALKEKGMDPKGDINTNGTADLFLGVKFQLISWTNETPQKEKTVSTHDNIRFSVAPGIKIPLGGPDFEEEAKNMGKDEDATFGSMDKHALAMGGRFYLDFMLSKNFFINLYNETIFYPVKQDLNKAGPEFYAIKGAIAPGMGPAAATVMAAEGEIDYKLDMTWEVEPNYTFHPGDGVSLAVGLPLKYTFSPPPEFSVETKLSGPAKAGVEKAIIDNLEAQFGKQNGTHTLGLNPSATAFFYKLPMPLEFKAQYNIPLWARSEKAKHTFALQIRAYFKIP